MLNLQRTEGTQNSDPSLLAQTIVKCKRPFRRFFGTNWDKRTVLESGNRSGRRSSKIDKVLFCHEGTSLAQNRKIITFTFSISARDIEISAQFHRHFIHSIGRQVGREPRSFATEQTTARNWHNRSVEDTLDFNDVRVVFTPVIFRNRPHVTQNESTCCMPNDFPIETCEMLAPVPDRTFDLSAR